MYESPHHREWSNPDGLGFLPAVAAAPAIWPGLVSVGAAIGGAIAKLFGADDQKTSYRPPADAAGRYVAFNDKLGNESVAYDMGAQTQAITAQKGNRWDDVSSYYSAFLSNSTKAGASSAARRVIEDVARQHGVSIARAADLVLQAAGAVRLARTGGGTANGSASLPPYCPVGTYHPYPIGHPQQDICVPFPSDSPSNGSNRSNVPATPTTRRARAGFWMNPQTGTEEPLPSCSSGLIFDPQSGQCVAMGDQSFGDGFPWWILLVVGGVLVATSGNDKPARRRR